MYIQQKNDPRNQSRNRATQLPNTVSMQESTSVPFAQDQSGIAAEPLADAGDVEGEPVDERI